MQDPSTSGRFVPDVYANGKKQPRFQQPVASLALDYFRLGAYQLVTVGGAAALAKTAVAPLERVKILMQVQPMLAPELSMAGATQQFSTLRQSLRRIIETHGWTALYRGNGANVARILPEVLLKFAVNDQFKIIFASTTDTKQMTLGSKLAAGATTGVLRTLAFHPLSVIRTRLTADVGTVAGPRLYANVLACVRDTWRTGALRGFYGGIGLATLTTAPYLAVCFTLYDELLCLLPSDKHACQLWWYPFAKMGIGAASGVGAQCVTYPLDTLRRRMEVNGSSGFKVVYPSAWACLRSIVSHEGWTALYRGCLVNCLKAAPSAAIQFIMYDTIKSAMMIIDPATAASSPL